MHTVRCFGQVAAAYIALGGALVFAQTQQPPNLDELLPQVEANADRYSATVPSFICNEQIH